MVFVTIQSHVLQGSHSLYPVNDLHAFAAVEQWLAVENDEYNPKVSKIVYETQFKKVFNPAHPEPDHAVVKEQLEGLAKVLGMPTYCLASSIL